MCGALAGLFEGGINPQQVDRALSSISHRGPDFTNKWISDDSRWFLGHTRLSIIGLDNGTQPIRLRQALVHGSRFGCA